MCAHLLAAQFNPSNAFDAEGLTRLTEEIETRKKKRNDIEKDTQNLEFEKLGLAIDQESEYARMAQEREIAMRRAQQRAEIAREKTDRDHDIEAAQIRVKKEIEKSRIKQELAVESEQLRREQDLQTLEIKRRRALELEEQECVIAVAQKSRAQSEAQTAAEVGRAETVEPTERVNTVRDTAIAERRKLIDLVEASQHAERDAIKLTIGAAAELRAAGDRAQAQVAAAEAAKVRYEIDAEGRRKLNEAENMRSEASRRSALQEDLIRSLPSIIRESVKPMEKIDSIKILQVDGLPGLSGTVAQGQGDGAGAGDGGGSGGGSGRRVGSLADQAVNSALRYRAQLPFVDGLLREIGMSPRAMTSTGGLTIFPVGEYPVPKDAERH